MILNNTIASYDIVLCGVILYHKKHHVIYHVAIYYTILYHEEIIQFCAMIYHFIQYDTVHDFVL